MDNELREIIREAWNIGNLYVEERLDRRVLPKDTFGAFLDRATRAIHDAGYRKVGPKELSARDYADAVIRIFESYRADIFRRFEIEKE